MSFKNTRYFERKVCLYDTYDSVQTGSSSNKEEMKTDNLGISTLLQAKCNNLTSQRFLEQV